MIITIYLMGLHSFSSNPGQHLMLEPEMPDLKAVYLICCFSYGLCTCTTNGSQKLTALSKWHDNKRGKFLKKLHGECRIRIWLLSSGLIMWICHSEETRKLTFQAF